MRRYRNVTMKLFTLGNEKCLGGYVFMEIKDYSKMNALGLF